MLEDVITNHGAVVFNGDGYTDDWQIEAEARGLANLRTTLDALPELVTDEAMELFSHYGVFTPPRDAQPLRHRARAVRAEHRRGGPPHARDRDHDRAAGRDALPDRARHEHRQPEGGRHRRRHGDARRGDVGDRRRCGPASPSCGPSSRTEGLDSTEKEAEHAGRTLLPAMEAVRAAADVLETLVADDLWPLATYQEMLFIL